MQALPRTQATWYHSLTVPLAAQQTSHAWWWCGIPKQEWKWSTHTF